jgi:cytochrome oxidase Cu insertion factor (SCO1/SenC/PrrC family)
MVLFSVASMGVASVSAAEPSLYEAQNGQASAADTPASTFTLTDQFDHSYTLGEHHGRYTLLTFLDPVCWTDCPLLAAQLKAVRADLGTNAKIDVVAVAANPDHQTLANVRHFIAIHDLSDVKNFYFVTGPTAATRKVWESYGIYVTNVPGSVMSVHYDDMFIINPKGDIRWIIPEQDPIDEVADQESTESELLMLLHDSGLS